MFDVVTTSIYRYVRYDGGPALEDRTLALKLFAGRHHSKAYPTTEELLHFGRQVCRVRQPALVLDRIASAMQATLDEAVGDERVPASLLAEMRSAWVSGLQYARGNHDPASDPA